MNKQDQEKVDTLSKSIYKYLDSKMTISDFIKTHIFKEYSESGDESLKDIASEYFLEHLE